MTKELDNRYLVLKLDDIRDFIDSANKRKLKIMVDKIMMQRAKRDSKPDKKYVVVSESMACYNRVKDIVINEIWPEPKKVHTKTTITKSNKKASDELVLQRKITKKKLAGIKKDEQSKN